MSVRIIHGNCREVLKTLPERSVQACVTSPPYFGLRSYLPDGHPDKHLEIGLEPTPGDYVAEMVAVFREVKRVLRDDGTVFLNLGDSYCSASSDGQYILRDDCSIDEVLRVGLEVFGVRFDRDKPACQGPLPEVLSDYGERSPLRERSDLAGSGVPARLSAEQGGGDRTDIGAQQADKTESPHRSRRKVRLLRGSHAGISDAGSHQRGWCGAPKEADRPCASILRQDLSGSVEDGMPAGPVPSALLELQLRDRLVGLLSARHVPASQIPSALRGCFRPVGLKPKDLLGIPWMVAFALRADGWFLRSDVIWSKPNPMPESVTDRPTSSHEHVFLLSKCARYFYDADAIRQQPAESSLSRWAQNIEDQDGSFRANGGAKTNGAMKAVRRKRPNGAPTSQFIPGETTCGVPDVGVNVRSVWTIATQPFKGSHFATMPPELAERCILAGTSERGCCPSCGAPWARETSKTRTRDGEPLTGSFNSTTDHRIGPTGVGHWRDKTVVETLGWAPRCECPDHRPIPCTVLDPFSGAGTTALVADRLGRSAIGIELNPDYAAMGADRVRADAPLFAEVSS